MARLKHFTRDIKLEVRLDQHSTQITTFGAKAGHVFEVPDGYYANYCVKKMGCVLVTPQSEAPKPPQPHEDAPAVEAAPEPVVAPAPVEEVLAAAEAAGVDVASEEVMPELAPIVEEPVAEDEAAPEADAVEEDAPVAKDEPADVPKPFAKKAGRPPKAK